MATASAVQVVTEVPVQPAAEKAATWVVDLKHSSIHFWVRHLMVSKVHGQFGQWTGDLHFDEGNLGASHVEVQIEAASIDTREPQRDTHLRSPDFFDVEKHPRIAFKSTRMEAAGEGNYRVSGELSLHGVTKPVVLQVEYSGRAKDPWGGERAGFTAKTTIDRKDFGLTYNSVIEAGGVMIGDKVEISIEVEAVRNP